MDDMPPIGGRNALFRTMDHDPTCRRGRPTRVDNERITDGETVELFSVRARTGAQDGALHHGVSMRPSEPMIRRAVRTLDAVVVMTSGHGRSGFTHRLAGAVPERVIERAPCPVLVPRQPGRPKCRRDGNGEGQ